MVRESDLPIHDANGVELHVGDTIMQGMRRGDTKGWDVVVIVRARASDEILGEDLETKEREELAGDPMLRGLVSCPH